MAAALLKLLVKASSRNEAARAKALGTARAKGKIAEALGLLRCVLETVDLGKNSRSAPSATCVRRQGTGRAALYDPGERYDQGAPLTVNEAHDAAVGEELVEEDVRPMGNPAA